MSKRQQLIWKTHKMLGMSVMEVYKIHQIAERKSNRNK